MSLRPSAPLEAGSCNLPSYFHAVANSALRCVSRLEFIDSTSPALLASTKSALPGGKPLAQGKSTRLLWLLLQLLQLFPQHHLFLLLRQLGKQENSSSGTDKPPTSGPAVQAAQSSGSESCDHHLEEVLSCCYAAETKLTFVACASLLNTLVLGARETDYGMWQHISLRISDVA